MARLSQNQNDSTYSIIWARSPKRFCSVLRFMIPIIAVCRNLMKIQREGYHLLRKLERTVKTDIDF